MGTYDNKLVVSGGSEIIDDTSAHTGLRVSSIVATEDTAVSVCTGTDNTGASYNFKTALNWDTLKQNDLLIAPDNYTITAITLTSGRIIANKL